MLLICYIKTNFLCFHLPFLKVPISQMAHFPNCQLTEGLVYCPVFSKIKLYVPDLV